MMIVQPWTAVNAGMNFPDRAAPVCCVFALNGRVPEREWLSETKFALWEEGINKAQGRPTPL